MTYLNKYYGPEKVKSVDEVDGKFIINFVDNKKNQPLKISKKILDISLTDKKSDWTDLKRVQLQAIAQDILSVMLVWDVKLEDVDGLNQLVVYSLNNNQAEAVDYMYGTKAQDRVMSDIDRVLMEKNNEHKETEA